VREEARNNGKTQRRKNNSEQETGTGKWKNSLAQTHTFQISDKLVSGQKSSEVWEGKRRSRLHLPLQAGKLKSQKGKEAADTRAANKSLGSNPFSKRRDGPTREGNLPKFS